MAADEHEEVKPRVVLKGGSSLVNCKPVFSLDSHYILLASGSSVKVISVKSGECVNELKGHRLPITCIERHPTNRYQILSCSLDRSIVKWDFTDGALLKRFEYPKAVYSLIATGLDEPVYIGLIQAKEKDYSVVKFSLTSPTFKTLERNILHHDQQVSFGCNAEILACIRGNQLIVQSFKTHQRQEHRLTSARKRSEEGKLLTTVACHPTEYCIATGTDIGSIHLWYNFTSQKKVVKNTVHWHALPVRCLSFTTEGSYFMSGGHECVLVKWQYNSEHRETLPRLGAPIINIACSKDNLYYLTCHSDNSLQIISNKFNVTQAIVGLTQAKLDEAAQTNQVPVGLLLDPRTDALVLNGRPGHLQFYALETDKQIFSLDVVCQNYISPANLKRPLFVTEVICAAFSEDGSWLATAEWRNDKETSPEQRLKFWSFVTKEQVYRLNTVVETPHADRIEQLIFRPQPAQLDFACMVSTSGDGKFKIWQVVDDSDIHNNKSSCWVCESVGFYREEPAGRADFSEDGSLLAVVFGSTLTFWNPDSNALQETLPLQDKIRDVIFGTGTCSYLLAIATEKKLVVWNMLSFSAHWVLPTAVSLVCKDPFTGHLAVFSPDNSLAVYSMSDRQPVYQHSVTSDSPVQAAVFIPHKTITEDSKLPWGSRSRLYFLNKRQELLCLSEEPEHTETIRRKVKEKLPETPFSLILSSHRRRDLTDTSTTMPLAGKPGASYLKEMLHTPAHVLPPVSTLCMSFVEKLMLNKNSASKETNVSEEDDGDSDDDKMEIEDSDSDQEVLKPLPLKKETKTPKSEPKLTQDFSKMKNAMFTWV